LTAGQKAYERFQKGEIGFPLRKRDKQGSWNTSAFLRNGEVV
jgi:hypothetical protein